MIELGGMKKKGDCYSPQKEDNRSLSLIEQVGQEKSFVRPGASRSHQEGAGCPKRCQDGEGRSIAIGVRKGS